MQILSILLALMLMTMSCAKNHSKVNEKNKLVIKIKTGNLDPNQIGYEKDGQTGEVTSVSSIYRVNDDLLLLDPVHNNIKIIDIQAGKVKGITEKISKTKVWLSDVVFFDDLIYVSSYHDTIYVLDASFRRVKDLIVKNPYGEKRFYFDQGRLYVSTYATENWQDKNFNVLATATELANSGVLNKDTISIGKGHESYVEKLDGFKIQEKDNSTCFSNSAESFCIQHDFQTLPYSCRNVVFGNGMLSFYELVGDDTLEVSVYKF